MNNWLYPLSSTADRWFIDSRTGKRTPVSFDSFRDLVVGGHNDDNEWTLSTNFKNVELGDRVWVYMGTGDIGVIGVGQIVARHIDGRDSTITIEFRKAASKRLCAKPYPAPKVRTFISHPRGAVQDMDRHPALVRAARKAAGL